MLLQPCRHQSWMNADAQNALSPQSVCEQACEPRNANFGLHVICHESREDLRCSVRLECHAALLELALQDGNNPDVANATSRCVGLCGCGGEDGFEEEG
jgi:hypothetical protein